METVFVVVVVGVVGVGIDVIVVVGGGAFVGVDIVGGSIEVVVVDDVVYCYFCLRCCWYL